MKIIRRHHKNKIIILILFLFFSLFLLTSCNKEPNIYIHYGDIDAKCYYIHTDSQKEYLDSSDYKIIKTKGTKELSQPNVITIKVKEDLGNGALLWVSEQDDFKDYITYEIIDHQAEVINLKIHTIYCYKGVSKDQSKETGVDYLYIDEDCMRNLSVEGLTNVRDVCSFNTLSYTYTKQGMIYRSSKLNDDESTTNLITQKGIDEINNHLKVKTEIDFRTVDDNENGGITSSPLGEQVNYISFPLESSGNIMLLNKTKWKDLFKIFADENNYPILFHCSIGTDRTGYVSFMLNALLDVGDGDLYRDYLFSNFASIGSQRTANTLEKNYYFVLDAYEGTTKEKMIAFLLAQGVEQSDIDKFIEIMKLE